MKGIEEEKSGKIITKLKYLWKYFLILIDLYFELSYIFY